MSLRAARETLFYFLKILRVEILISFSVRGTLQSPIGICAVDPAESVVLMRDLHKTVTGERILVLRLVV